MIIFLVPVYKYTANFIVEYSVCIFFSSSEVVAVAKNIYIVQD